MVAVDDLQKVARAMQRECLALRVRRLNRRVTRVYDAAFRSCGVSTAQLNILVAIALGGSTRPKDIARALDLEKSTLSRNLDRMIERRWVAVTQNENGTAQTLKILPAGRKLFERSLSAWEEAQRTISAELGTELVRALGSLGAPT